MKALLVSKLIQMLVGMLTPELLKQFVDQAIDFVENYVVGTKSTVDDNIVLPLCKMLRTAFDIPDED